MTALSNNSSSAIAGDCDPDTTPAGRAYNICMLVLIAACTLFNLSSILACAGHAARLKSPAFYVLANLFLAYALHLIFDFFLPYLEAASTLRLYLPFSLEANLGGIGAGIGTHLFFLFAASRFLCIFATLRYERIFSKRNTWLAIGVAWLLGVHRQLQRMLHGEQLEHCWRPGYVQYRIRPDSTVLVGEMPVVQFVEFVQKLSMATPTLFDIAVLVKLAMERAPFSPFHKVYESPEQRASHADRVRTFMVCLATSAYHVLFVFVLFPYIPNRDWFHVFNLLATVLPALLILLFSHGYRKEYRRAILRLGCYCTKKNEQRPAAVSRHVRVVPGGSTVMAIVQLNHST